MSCCGGNRAAQRTSYQTSSTISQRGLGAASRTPSPATVEAIRFEYTGAAPLVITGPATGAAYRFERSGTRLSVHAADAPSLIAVPGLHPVR